MSPRRTGWEETAKDDLGRLMRQVDSHRRQETNMILQAKRDLVDLIGGRTPNEIALNLGFMSKQFKRELTLGIVANEVIRAFTRIRTALASMRITDESIQGRDDPFGRIGRLPVGKQTLAGYLNTNRERIKKRIDRYIAKWERVRTKGLSTGWFSKRFNNTRVISVVDSIIHKEEYVNVIALEWLGLDVKALRAEG